GCHGHAGRAERLWKRLPHDRWHRRARLHPRHGPGRRPRRGAGLPGRPHRLACHQPGYRPGLQRAGSRSCIRAGVRAGCSLPDPAAPPRRRRRVLRQSCQGPSGPGLGGYQLARGYVRKYVAVSARGRSFGRQLKQMLDNAFRRLRTLLAHSLARNIGWLFLFQISTYLSFLLVIPWLTHVLPASEYGAVMAVMAAAQFCFILTDYGFSASATYEVARCRGDAIQVQDVIAQVHGAKIYLVVLA